MAILRRSVRGEITVDKIKSAPKSNIGVVAPGTGHTAGSKHVSTTRRGLTVARRSTTLGTLSPRLESVTLVGEVIAIVLIVSVE